MKRFRSVKSLKLFKLCVEHEDNFPMAQRKNNIMIGWYSELKNSQKITILVKDLLYDLKLKIILSSY
jgi:hypothetical protein